jgi:NADH:ubiquinone oxidoreductase subunit 3 (subunit A)
MGSLISFWLVIIFFLILTLGFIYEWYMGALKLT